MRGPRVLARDKRLGGNIHAKADIQTEPKAIWQSAPLTPTSPALVQFAVPTAAGGSYPVIDIATSGST